MPSLFKSTVEKEKKRNSVSSAVYNERKKKGKQGYARLI